MDHPPFFLVWVWPHSLAVMWIVIATLVAVLGPKIRLSHRRDKVTLSQGGVGPGVKVKLDNTEVYVFPYNNRVQIRKSGTLTACCSRALTL